MNTLILDLQIALNKFYLFPRKMHFMYWLTEVYRCIFKNQKIEITIRLVESNESKRLNMMFCNKRYSTNILVFPFEYPKNIEKRYKIFLGDIVICPVVLENEIKKEKKLLAEHWVHMVVHSALHLVKYDHVSDIDACVMRNLEIKIMQKLGYMNPYI
ncbi:MAG: endoribonuclease YbeY [Candidatus Westeberhardia cardiocondylae]|nr:endoribonuclease YbeY [Candidatus Westeberhardia cardiocondylae]